MVSHYYQVAATANMIFIMSQFSLIAVNILENPGPNGAHAWTKNHPSPIFLVSQVIFFLGCFCSFSLFFIRIHLLGSNTPSSEDTISAIQTSRRAFFQNLGLSGILSRSFYPHMFKFLFNLPVFLFSDF